MKDALYQPITHTEVTPIVEGHYNSTPAAPIATQVDASTKRNQGIAVVVVGLLVLAVGIWLSTLDFSTKWVILWSCLAAAGAIVAGLGGTMIFQASRLEQQANSNV